MEKEKMIQRVAKELASEIVIKEKNPTYNPVLNRNECIKKLCTIYDEDFSSLSEKFDHYVEKYRKSPDIFSL
jgi:hypothetical protein